MREGFFCFIPSLQPNFFVANYAFQAVAGTNTPISGTMATIASGNFNDDFSNAIPPGFTFICNGNIYTTSWVVGSRVFTLQWANVLWNFATMCPCVSFQLKLYEGINILEFVYRQEASAVELNSSGAASIGITAKASYNITFLSLSDASNNPSVSYNVETTTTNRRLRNRKIIKGIPYCTATGTGVEEGIVIDKMKSPLFVARGFSFTDIVPLLLLYDD